MQVLGKLEHANLSKEEARVYTSSEHYAVVSGERVTRKCLNLGSYNYLGFADDWNVTCRKGVMGSLNGLPVSMGSSRMECGTSILHDTVEKIVAEFVGKEDAMVVNMGFNTNATTIPALMGRGDLIVSDEFNHTSIVNGARISGSAIRCFRHNDTKHLEEILKEAIVMGQPRTRRPWKRIMVIVEGIYSMEGEYCDLRNVVKVCKEYGAYVYLDEAHSVGAMGATGRGCCEYTGVDPKDVDVMMGTFTKSFGGMGGYIAGSMDVIDFLREKCAASTYHNSLSPTVCQQIISSFEVSLFGVCTALLCTVPRCTVLSIVLAWNIHHVIKIGSVSISISVIGTASICTMQSATYLLHSHYCIASNPIQFILDHTIRLSWEETEPTLENKRSQHSAIIPTTFVCASATWDFMS